MAGLERGAVGGGATGAGMGYVPVVDDRRATLALAHCGGRLWGAAPTEAPGRHGYARAARSDRRRMLTRCQAVHDKRRRFPEPGVACGVLGAAARCAREPVRRPGLVRGLLVPDDGVVHAPGSVAAFLDRCRLRRGRAAQLLQGGGRPPPAPGGWSP